MSVRRLRVKLIPRSARGDEPYWRAATVDCVLRGDLVKCGGSRPAQPVRRLRNAHARHLARSNKRQNLGRDYVAMTKRLHDLGVMINGSFVFGMDDDDETVFRRTVDWAIEKPGQAFLLYGRAERNPSRYRMPSFVRSSCR